jgi:hypothetical protein
VAEAAIAAVDGMAEATVDAAVVATAVEESAIEDHSLIIGNS